MSAIGVPLGGGGIRQLTGDVTAGPGSGSQAATLSTVNASPGTYTYATVTVDGKGRVTAASSNTVDFGAAVILAPGSSTRNIIQPTGDFKPLIVKRFNNVAASNLLEVQDENGNLLSAFNSSGQLGLGDAPTTELTVYSTSNADPRGIMSAQYSSDTSAARIHLRKARGTIATPTTVVTGDILGRLRFSGYDGANFLQMASIDAVSTGTIASTRVPTYLSFSVATDAAPSVLTEMMRLTTTGLGIGAAPSEELTVRHDQNASTRIAVANNNTSSLARLQFAMNNGSSDVALFSYNLNSPNLLFGTFANSPINIVTNSNIVVTISATGALGVNSSGGIAKFSVVSDSTSLPVLIARAAASASADIATFQTSTPTNVVRIGPTGATLINPTDAAVIPLTVKGAASQSANLQEWQTSTPTTVASVSSIGAATFKPVDAVTNAVTNVLTLAHTLTTANAGAAGIATALVLQAADSTAAIGAAVTQADITSSWVVATHASRTGRLVFSVYDTAAREGLRIEASGSAPMIGFLGAAAVVRQTTYTQTYSTTTTTVNPSSTSAFTGQDNAQAGTVYAKVADLNTLRTDMLQLAQLINKLIDDNQAYGLAA